MVSGPVHSMEFSDGLPLLYFWLLSLFPEWFSMQLPRCHGPLIVGVYVLKFKLHEVTVCQVASPDVEHSLTREH